MDLQKLGVSTDAEAMFRESQRALMIENYRQSVALTAVAGLAVDASRAEREDQVKFDPVAIADKAWAVADALAVRAFKQT